jgi:uncharacterized damage-inducible protein DinB
MGLLDHTTHHRASAEMYLRAKGITPAVGQVIRRLVRKYSV